MPSNPTFYAADNRWERADTEITDTFDFVDPTTDDQITIFRTRKAGRITGARFIPKATLAAGTANYYQIGLINGGTAAAASGTVVICAQVGGTAAGGTAPGWTADTDVDLPVTGTATFVAGEAIVIDYDETGTVAPSGRLQVSYRYDP